MKFKNPLFQERVKSQSSDIKLTGESLEVLTSAVCPKCGNATTPVQMADGGAALFCDGCRVTMPKEL